MAVIRMERRQSKNRALGTESLTCTAVVRCASLTPSGLFPDGGHVYALRGTVFPVRLGWTAWVQNKQNGKVRERARSNDSLVLLACGS